jgi:hypothetical protein
MAQDRAEPRHQSANGREDSAAALEVGIATAATAEDDDGRPDWRARCCSEGLADTRLDMQALPNSAPSNPLSRAGIGDSHVLNWRPRTALRRHGSGADPAWRNRMALDRMRFLYSNSVGTRESPLESSTSDGLESSGVDVSVSLLVSRRSARVLSSESTVHLETR